MSKLLITLEVSVETDLSIHNEADLFEYVRHALEADWYYGDVEDDSIDVTLVEDTDE